MNTTISIKNETRTLLQDYGKKSETYDDVIKRMINTLKLQEEIEEFLNENEYSTLEEAEEWTRFKIKEND